MAFVAFLLAAFQFLLVGFAVAFPTDSAVRNIAAGLFLVAVGLLLPGAVALYDERRR